MFKTVTELTELNEKLQKKAEAALSLSAEAEKAIRDARTAIRARYESPEYSEMPQAMRQQNARFEEGKAMAGILRDYSLRSKEAVREVAGLAEAIRAAESMYQPIKRLNIQTTLDDELADRRARYAETLASASIHDLLTMVDVFESSNDLAGLAAISSVVDARNDKRLRKAIPNARLVRNVGWSDQDQLDAIFHAGRHMVDIVLEHDRSVAAAARGRPAGGIDRVRAGMRSKEAPPGAIS